MAVASRKMVWMAALATVIATTGAFVLTRQSASEANAAGQTTGAVPRVHAAVETDAVEAIAATQPSMGTERLDHGVRGAESLSPSQRRDGATSIDVSAMPMLPHRHPRLAATALGSVSVGTVTAGYLVDAAEMPVESATARVLDVAVPRNTRYTTAAMRKMLLCAAGAVAEKYPGAVMQVGNLSRLSGGPLPWSVSHHNGRDADVAFYVRDTQRAFARMERLYHFDRSRQSTDAPERLTFDVAANWAFVRALLQCRPDGIQHIFVADWLRQAMLEHAARTRMDKVKKTVDKKKLAPMEAALVARAERILHQPPRALPHNDHLHVRIACSSEDLSEGCADASRAPPEIWGSHPLARARLPQLRKLLATGTATERADAAYLLGLLHDDASLTGLRDACRDPDAGVRREAAAVLGRWGSASAAQTLAAALQRETDSAAAVAQLNSLAQVAGVAELATACKDLRVISPSSAEASATHLVVRWAAATYLGDMASLGGGDALVSLLTDSEPLVRDTARRSLQRLTNVTTADLAGDAGSAQTPTDPLAEQALWRTFLAQLPAGSSRDVVALQGLKRRGVEVDVAVLKPLGQRGLANAARRKTALAGLVQALAMPSPWRDNAARWLEQATDYRPQVGSGARLAPVAYWPPFLVQRRLVDRAVVQARLAAARRQFPTAADADQGTVGGSGGAAAGEPD